MPQNVEIKAALPDPQHQLRLAEALCGHRSAILDQQDVFFRCPRGRLKLRIFREGTGELIHYERNDQNGPKTSSYTISRTSDPPSLRQALSNAYGELATVRKTRHLFLSGRTRIHLDRVEGLGDFLELEVVLADGESVSSGQQEAQSLMAKLDIQEDMLIDVAYVDLLERAL